ncbi:MAG: hypothetical protein AB1589_46300 [Cyanobacteriota bacterium]
MFENRTIEDMAWELAEDLVAERFYIKAPYIPTLDNVATKPAFLLFRDMFGARWTLVMDQLHIWEFTSKKKAYEKLKEIANSASQPIKILVKTRKGYKTVAESSSVKEV